MCGRYKTNTEQEIIEIRDILKEISIKLTSEDIKYLDKETTPGSKAPVITNKHELKIIDWGFTKWDNKGLIFNAKSETVKTSNYFKQDFEYGKCIIPASSYFEWQKLDEKTKQKYEFKLKENKILFIAGFTKIESDGKETYTIITKSAQKNISFIHDRMPLLLTKEEAINWLNNTSIEDILLKNNFINDLSFEKLK